MHWHVNLCSRARCLVQCTVALIEQCTCILCRLAAVAYNIDHTTSNSILSGIMELNWNEKEHEKHEALPKNKTKNSRKKDTWSAHRQTARTTSAFFGFNDFCFSFHQTKRTSTGEITRNIVQVCTLLHDTRVSGTKEANAAKNRYTQIDGTRLRAVITVSTERTPNRGGENEASRIFRWCITLNESIWLFFRLHFFPSRRADGGTPLGPTLVPFSLYSNRFGAPVLRCSMLVQCDCSQRHKNPLDATIEREIWIAGHSLRVAAVLLMAPTQKTT